MVGTLIFSLMVAGCSSPTSNSQGNASGTNSEGQIELKLLHKWPQPEYSPYFEEVVKEFEKQNPSIKVKVEAVADEPMKDKLRVIMGGGSVPDIMFSWSGEFARKFVRSGAALDLTEYLNADTEWKNSFIPASLQPFTADGKNYGVPLRFNGKFFVYNKEIFDKYQLQKPKNWDEFLQTLDKLKQAGETPIILGNASPWAGIHYLTGLNQKIVNNDVRMKDYHPKSGEFTDPNYIKALEYFKNLKDKGYFNDNINSSSHDMANQMFYAGKGAMMYLELEEFPQVEQSLSGKWDFFPMPDIAEGQGNHHYITGAPDGFIVSSKTKHPKEALAFLKFITSKQNAEKMAKQLGWPSPIVGATNPETALKQVAEGVELLRGAEGMAEWLDTDVHTKVAEAYLSNVQLLLDGTKSPEDIMKEVQAVAQEVKNEVE